mmetsp:Transcript_4747/g.11204  ORF Transcript_4747/g.11204 Transcript_4747/m.11204 type:complete len:81 (+) Transcript_4747:7-249(+)
MCLIRDYDTYGSIWKEALLILFWIPFGLLLAHTTLHFRLDFFVNIHVVLNALLPQPRHQGRHEQKTPNGPCLRTKVVLVT